MTTKAYAKINLILNILGKRADGFHEIETVFQAIDLYDIVSVEPNADNKVPFENDLSLRALDLMKEHFSRSENYGVQIEKHIPVAAGLGGGSADAAAVIYILACLWKIDECEELYELAAKLGSDVAFCLATQFGHMAAIGRGRGEKLEFIESTKAFVSLKRSDFELSEKTKAVYSALIPEDYLVKYNITEFINSCTLEEKQKYLGNHLQKALERLSEKKIDDWILCGAGPTYFKLGSEGSYKTL